MEEKEHYPMSGYIMFVVVFLMFITALFGLIAIKNPFALILLFFTILLFPGFFFINPNSSRVLVLFGVYIGTVKKNGFFWVNPLYMKKMISLRARNFDSDKIKVNDKVGNPILIGVILVWQVRDTFKAAFEVDDYVSFVKIQSDAAVRKLAGSYPYDNFDDEMAEITLRSGIDEVNHAMEGELKERLEIAGIHVIEARIGYLAYASEIAGAMLRRQQASAIIAARKLLVAGAVGMVEMALAQLKEKGVVELDEERKAAMVSNLLVVLCGEDAAQPVVNTGSLYI